MLLAPAPAAHAESSSLSSTWYLAEGSTDWGFQTNIFVENPNDTSCKVRMTFMTPNGPVQKPDFVMTAMSTVSVDPSTTLGEADFSTKVQCLTGQGIAVERTMAWPENSGDYFEGHSSIGVTAPSKTWYLAEGSSKWGFECWILVQNPNKKQAHVQLTYMIEGAGPKVVDKIVPAKSRRSFFMADDIGSADASVRVSADVPVIPERAMYRNGRREGSGSIGTTAPASDYYLAEGTTDWGFTTYILVQNPNPQPTHVTVTYMTPEGPIRDNPFTMAANSRTTIAANDVHPGKDLSTHVHGSRPIIAERAMYWSTETGEACHDSIGLSAPHTTFYLPDGESEPYDPDNAELGIETWTLVQNPNGFPVKVQISYIDQDVSSTVSIPANTRKTFNMADHFSTAPTASGIIVKSLTTGGKIMVEKSTYVLERTAGTDTIGAYSDEDTAIPVATGNHARSSSNSMKASTRVWNCARENLSPSI
jgi:hypothetical protein